MEQVIKPIFPLTVTPLIFPEKTMKIANPAPSSQLNGKGILKLSGQFWFLIAFIGQWLFVYYVAFFYGPSGLQGNFEVWNEVMPHGYIKGELTGNIIVGIHLLLAVLITLGGHLQLIPQVRQYAPAFHRWNGRFYLIIAFVISLSGLYMVWIREAAGGMPGHVGISLNAVLIMLFAVMALRTALQRNFDQHFRWVLRLFLVVSGVWFFRVGMMLWLMIHGGPVGFDPNTLQGPFVTFLVFGQFLIPLTVLEIYLKVQKDGNNLTKLSFAAVLLGLTILTGIGIFGATMGMWLPRVLPS